MNKTRIWIFALVGILTAILLLTSFATAKAEPGVPKGSWVVTDRNSDKTIFTLEFKTNRNYVVRAECTQKNVKPPEVGAICKWDGSKFSCPKAQDLAFLKIIKTPKPPPKTATFTSTPTPTATLVPTHKPTHVPTDKPQKKTPTKHPTAHPTDKPPKHSATSTPFLPGAPFVYEFQVK
jgi:hypothetical protein